MWRKAEPQGLHANVPGRMFRVLGLRAQSQILVAATHAKNLYFVRTHLRLFKEALIDDMAHQQLA